MQDQSALTTRKQAEQFFQEGVRCMMKGNVREAERHFLQAIGLCPDMGEARVNLGWLQEQQGDLDAAEQSYRNALKNGTHAPEVFMNLGALILAREQPEAASVIFQEGLKHHPASARLWSNLGMAQACLKQDAAAENSYRNALRHDPAQASAHVNLAYVLLRHGRYAEGFSCLEARDWYAGLTQQLTDHLGIPRWHGESSITGHTLLIACEAGHGDMIQFCRYARQLRLAGAKRIGILCHPGLVRLFTRLRDAEDIYAIDASIPAECWDFWCPALSLPHLCGTTQDNIPASLPYLQAWPEDVQRRQKELTGNALQVGLVWRGNPDYENDRHRSLPGLQTLTPLWSVPGIHFISLQKGAAGDDADGLLATPAMTRPDPGLDDFADTAGLISNLDLLISVDTGCAHLAGALGIPCWILLPAYKTDWRWLTEERTDSPWYPGVVRLFRQQRIGDWSAVISELTHALHERVQSFGGRL